MVSAVTASPAADTQVALGDTVAAVTELEWSSSDEPVARVDDSGLVTGADAGTATTTATEGEYAGTTEMENPERAALVALARLHELLLPGNGLSGSIPAELGNLTSLPILDLAANHLLGAIPGGLGRLANLNTLNLGDNRLSGPLSQALGRAAPRWRISTSGPIGWPGRYQRHTATSRWRSD
ncbi:MAG: Ig-like domain-containing protein [Gemmatimonadota bacterium]|nr:Ig-like domain-containing protein [Gemmatimonadota bacterium]